NDARITMGDAWGQGARNALLIVGDFMQQTAKEKLVDTKAKFNAPHDTSQPDPEAIERMKEAQQAEAQAKLQTQQPIVVVEPDLTWTQDRQRSTQYQDSAGFSAPP